MATLSSGAAKECLAAAEFRANDLVRARSASSDADFLAKAGGIIITMQSFSQGGGDRVAVLLANGLARAGIPTRLLLMRDSGDGEQELLSLLHPDVSIRVGGPPVELPFARIFERLRGVGLIRSQIADFRPAVVLAATDNMAFATALACRRDPDRPVFALKLTNRLFRPNIGPIRYRYRRRLFDFIFERADLVLTLADAERLHVRAHYPDKAPILQTIVNPYVTEQMLATALFARSDAPRLLSAGRMVPQKRFDVLLRAFALIKRKDATLTILGDGPLRSTLESLARSLGIADRVRMPGFADIIPELLQSDLFILSSDHEGLPAALIEALACNVPVITTESFLAAYDLLASAGSCLIVSRDNPPALSRAIDHCLERANNGDEDLRDIARPYAVDASVEAHIGALAAVSAKKLARNHLTVPKGTQARISPDVSQGGTGKPR